MNEQDFTQEEANQFIIECHSDLEMVRKKVVAKPALVNAFNPELNESALGASGHMGRADIAEFLLSQGARPEFATYAMLGQREKVAEWLAKDPGLANSGGAHDIPVAFHAAMSGNTQIMQMLWDTGAQEPVKESLIGAVMLERTEMVRWLLEHDAQTDVKAFNGMTALEIAEKKGMTEIVEMLAARA